MFLLDQQTLTDNAIVMPPSSRVSDQLRRLIEHSGKTRYRIAKETGLSQSLLSRFMSGERGLSLAAVDDLAANLSLRLVSSKASEKRSKR